MSQTKPVYASFRSIGAYVPEKILSNEDLEKMVDTTDEWIVKRTGIKERRIAAEDEYTSDMAAKACELAIERSSVPKEEIDLVICATVTPDYFNMPSTACLISDKIGIRDVQAFDISAACSGFVYLLTIAKAFIESGMKKNVLIIGAEKMSAITDYTDRTTCVLFGDAGGAVLMEPNTEGYGIIDTKNYTDGSGRIYLYQTAGGSVKPPTHETIDAREHYIHQEGQQVFKFAVKGMADVSVEMMERNNLTSDELTIIIAKKYIINMVGYVGAWVS